LLNTGNTIVIEHGGGLKSMYYHMNSLSVAQGATVQQGQLLGTVGTTGYSTGNHLHFEMRLFNETVNPMSLFQGTGSIFAFDDPDNMPENTLQPTMPESDPDASEAGEGEEGEEDEDENEDAERDRMFPEIPIPEGDSEGLPKGLVWPSN
jgi:pyruvate/2-oxoglutarate dehydrogenase complex dihydrolipoamide acyltransferase (E2) component